MNNKIEDWLSSKATDEQKEIIYSKDKHIIVNGVPGSAKTTTLVIKLVLNLKSSEKKMNCVLLTKVSNVTEEIVNKIQKYLPDINFIYSNNSSRVTAKYNGHHIELSNTAAFIDSQLRHYWADINTNTIKYKNIYNIEVKANLDNKDLWGNYSKKWYIFRSLANEKKLKFKLKNGKPITTIILDECQDSSQEKAICYLDIINNNNIGFWGFGDILQSIWYYYVDNYFTKNYPNEPIRIFCKIEGIKQFYLSNCFRCPWWHCEFSKIINEKANKKYNRKEIKSIFPKPEIKNGDIIHKPMYFMHGATNSNVDAHQVAMSIFIIVKTVMELDKDIKFGDVRILSNKVNGSIVYKKLEAIFRKNKFPCHLFETKNGNDDSITIDMNLIKEEKCSKCKKKFNNKSNKCKHCGALRHFNKIAMMSVHAYKGGEGKLIITFGQSEKSVPSENSPGTPNELRYLSLFGGVSISRSKKYFFIGSNQNPSRYITNNIDKLSNAMYLIQDLPESLKSFLPDNIKEKKQNSMDKNRVYIKYLKKIIKAHDNNDINELKNFKMHTKDKNIKKKINFIINIVINNLEMPEIYKKVSQAVVKNNYTVNKTKKFNLPLKNLRRKNRTQKKTPDINDLTPTNINEHINSWNFVEDVISEYVNIEEKTFGPTVNITYKNSTSILGHLPNIVISLKALKNEKWYPFKSLLYDIIQKNQNVLYIDPNAKKKDGTAFWKDINIFNILKDKLNYKNFLEGASLEVIKRVIDDDMIKEEKKRVIYQNLDILCGLNRPDNINIILLPSYFKNVFNDIKLENNRKIWNICLLYDFVFSNVYIESSYMINNHTEYFTGNLIDAISNIELVSPKFKNILLEVPCNKINYDETDRKILRKELLLNPRDYCIKGYPCSVDGRIDGFSNNTIYEFKMSKSLQCKKEWINQLIIYNYLGLQGGEGSLLYHKSCNEKRIDTFKLYNFMTGKEYIINFDKPIYWNYPEYWKEILKQCNFRPKLRENFLNKILKYNNI